MKYILVNQIYLEKLMKKINKMLYDIEFKKCTHKRRVIPKVLEIFLQNDNLGYCIECRKYLEIRKATKIK